MRIRHNITLLIIVIFLLIAITEITGLPEAEINKVAQQEGTSHSQINNLEIIWDISVDLEEQRAISNREILNSVINSIPNNVNLNLRATNSQSLKENEVLVLNVVNGASLDGIDKLARSSNSSIAPTLVKTAINLISREGQGYILLVTDRESNSEINEILPSEAANRVAKHNVKVYVLQLGEPEEEISQELKLTAELGGGRYFSYDDKDLVLPVMNLLE